MTTTTGTSNIRPQHLVAFPSFFWGHTRPMCTLVARISRLRPTMKITFVTFPSIHSRVQEEVVRDFQPGEEYLKDNIRVVAIEEDTKIWATSGAPGAFKAAWINLVECQPLICAKTGLQIEALPIPPTAAVLDAFVTEAYEAAREVTGRTIPLYTWFAASTNTLPFVFGEDPLPAVETEVARTGLPFHKVARKMMMTITGAVIHSPCMPSMYDYEFHPQGVCTVPSRFLVLFGLCPKRRTCSIIKSSDGLITFDTADYHPEATATARRLFGETSREVFYAGPLLPVGAQATLRETRNSNNGDKIMSFLDDKLTSRGERSVIYIAFGSLFWPQDPAKVSAVLDVIMERNVPFVMSHASAAAGPLPVELLDKISVYGNGIVSDWVPQQAVLDHPATGWYLMHGGHNSTLETIMAGVPMIVWPIDADQPYNAVYLSEGLNVAYELIEVRHGSGLGKIYRNGHIPIGTVDAVKDEMRGVLEKAFGQDGTEKRGRLQVLQNKLKTAWSDDGIARREVEAFLGKL
ncbi:UDP-Glycosyltransferase/glycogen phosphorylase [Trametes meyenii]|nr:UDP-Glycosyltransferase/glycogen phosphorylase [Trametes meyenii]